MKPLSTFTQVRYKGIAGEIIECQEGFDYAPDGCMYMLELANNTYPILKRGEFEVIQNGTEAASLFMGMEWQEVTRNAL